MRRWRNSAVAAHAGLAIAIAGGCGRLGFAGSSDASTDGVDSEAADAGCTLGEWAAPTMITELSTIDDEVDPSISRDGLTLYFASVRGGARDIWTSTRPSIGAPWSAPAKVPELSTSTDEEGNPDVSPDGLEMYYGLSTVFRKTRASTAESFANQVEGLGAIFGFSAPIAPQITSDGLELYFAAIPAGGVLRQLFRARRAAPTATAMWTDFEMLPVTDATRENNFMALSPDGLELVFSRDFGGPNWDLWRITRPSTSGEFDPATQTPLSQLNTTSSDADPEITSTNREMIFDSDRPGAGGYDLYVTTRDCQ